MPSRGNLKKRRWLERKRLAREAQQRAAQPVKRRPPAPTCPYCGEVAVFRPSSAEVYRGRDYGPVWVCAGYPSCDAYVGCHPDGVPLGRLAREELRDLKKAAHALLDPLWRARMRRDGLKKEHARARAYAWLAEQLGIDGKDCHVGMFDEETCWRAIRLLRPHYDKLTEEEKRS